MDSVLKQRWIEALRSGEYLQGSGKLRTGNRFCCLGVLCDIIDSNGWVACDRTYLNDRLLEKEYPSLYVNKEDLTKHKYEVPRTLANKIHLLDDYQGILAEMNDTGESFEEIADWIEENL